MTFLHLPAGVILGYPPELPLSLVVHGIGALMTVVLIVVAWRVWRG
jgi:hypothetical protein